MAGPAERQPGRIFRDFGVALRDSFGIVGGGTSPDVLRTDLGVLLVADMHALGGMPLPTRAAWWTTQANTLDVEAHVHELRNPGDSRTRLAVDRVLVTVRDQGGLVEWRAVRNEVSGPGVDGAFRDRPGVPVGQLASSTVPTAPIGTPELLVVQADDSTLEVGKIGAVLEPGSRFFLASNGTFASNTLSAVTWFWREATL